MFEGRFTRFLQPSASRKLYLSGNPFSSLPESFSNLSKLEYLHIKDCSQLQLLPPLPSHLEEIEAINCVSLDVMPFDSMQNAYIFPSKAFKESRTHEYYRITHHSVRRYLNKDKWVSPTIYNKTKGTSHQFYKLMYRGVQFHPLNDTTLLVEAGDTVELQFDDNESVKSFGLHLIYEDDVVDSD
ncbi:TMV resistance protein N [Tanacetum coccineum]